MSLLKNNLKLGVFIAFGTLIMVLGIFVIGSKESLFTKTIKISAYFHNIEGLRKGAPARLSGINVGSVSEIKILNDNSGRVEVFIDLEKDIKRLIRLDSKAYVETEGLVGNKVVILSLGSAEQPEVKDGDHIIGVEPLGLAAILDQVRGVLENTKSMTKDLSEIVHKVNAGDGSIGKLLNDPALFHSANHLLVTADKGLAGVTTKFDSLATVVGTLGSGVNGVLRDINAVVANIDSVVVGLKQGKGLIGAMLADKSHVDTSVAKILTNLVNISDDVKLGSSRFAENMEALKRNWLFSSYFEQRGYYDKSAYEKQLDDYLNQINGRIKVLDEKIQTLNNLKNEMKKPK